MPKPPSFPGFTPITDQIFTRDGLPSSTHPTTNQPRVVIIFAWGDALPKHILKYCDGFRTFYPAAKQIAVLSPIYKALWRSMAQRTEAMTPVLNAAFGPDGQKHDGNILVHVMSNTGGIAYAATLHAYRNIYGKALPHQLVTLDSTPGNTDLTFENMKRLSLAMALGTTSWFPWPFWLTQSLWAFFLYIMNIIELILGRKSAGLESRLAVENPQLCTLDARQLYLYGKADRIILYSDIESHIATARETGWKADSVCFEGSGHVEHMRREPGQYWHAVRQSWEETTGPGEFPH